MPDAVPCAMPQTPKLVVQPVCRSAAADRAGASVLRRLCVDGSVPAEVAEGPALTRTHTAGRQPES